MLDTPCSEVQCKTTGYPVHSHVSPFTSPNVRHRVPSGFCWSLQVAMGRWFGGRKGLWSGSILGAMLQHVKLYFYRRYCLCCGTDWTLQLCQQFFLPFRAINVLAAQTCFLVPSYPQHWAVSHVIITLYCPNTLPSKCFVSPHNHWCSPDAVCNPAMPCVKFFRQSPFSPCKSVRGETKKFRVSVNKIRHKWDANRIVPFPVQVNFTECISRST